MSANTKNNNRRVDNILGKISGLEKTVNYGQTTDFNSLVLQNEHSIKLIRSDIRRIPANENDIFVILKNENQIEIDILANVPY